MERISFYLIFLQYWFWVEMLMSLPSKFSSGPEEPGRSFAPWLPKLPSHSWFLQLAHTSEISQNLKGESSCCMPDMSMHRLMWRQPRPWLACFFFSVVTQISSHNHNWKIMSVLSSHAVTTACSLPDSNRNVKMTEPLCTSYVKRGR